MGNAGSSHDNGCITMPTGPFMHDTICYDQSGKAISWTGCFTPPGVKLCDTLPLNGSGVGASSTVKIGPLTEHVSHGSTPHVPSIFMTR